MMSLTPGTMDINHKTRSSRPSRRNDLLHGQWEQKRFQQHRERVRSAKPRIDVKEPISTSFQHVQASLPRIYLQYWGSIDHLGIDRHSRPGSFNIDKGPRNGSGFFSKKGALWASPLITYFRSLPDRAFPKFRASKSVDRQILCRW